MPKFVEQNQEDRVIQMTLIIVTDLLIRRKYHSTASRLQAIIAKTIHLR
jgi:hypothetical protein